MVKFKMTMGGHEVVVDGKEIGHIDKKRVFFLGSSRGMY